MSIKTSHALKPFTHTQTLTKRGRKHKCKFVFTNMLMFTKEDTLYKEPMYHQVPIYILFFLKHDST